MLSELASYDWEQAFQVSSTRPAVPNQVAPGETPTREMVEQIIAIEEGENDGANWLLVAKLHDGRFICVSAGCDYTGWDCRAGGDILVAATLEDALRYGLDDEERERLKVQLQGKDIRITLSSKWKLRPIESKP
jgi:hypothetical protein